MGNDTTPSCKIEDCSFVIKRIRLGYCSRHYDRLRLTGSLYSSKNERKYFIKDNIVYIPLFRGGYTTVDAKNEHFAKLKWSVSKGGYAIGTLNNKRVYLHKLIMPDKNSIVDHINRDKLDNTLSNLRYVTARQNSINRKNESLSKYKGVWSNQSKINPYAAVIATPDGDRIWIGAFPSALEAAKAYNAKALELWGEYAYLNNV